MKSYLSRILLCVVPVVLATLIVAWAYYYGKFRLGVDLVGGTILVYEVDKSKQGDQEVKPEELAAALKRRIDPADLLNVTIRPAGGETPRVEIILPTGGQAQQKAEAEAWNNLVAEVAAKFPPPEEDAQAYASVPLGKKEALIQLASDLHKKVDKDVNPKEISQFVEDHYKVAKGRRALTSEEVENIKALIGQQGRLEFRILANPTDDNEAIKRASEYIDNEAHAAELDRLAVLGEPPPPPRAEDGSLLFPITLNGETINTSYSWVEVGKEELYNLHLNNAAENQLASAEQWKRVAEARQQKKAVRINGDILLYSRDVYSSRLAAKDRELG